jgi:oligopeptide/dipeptide ABC transporter ATP-binding protein
MVTLLDVTDLHTEFVTRRGVVRAVDGVSISIEEGETHGIVGESGSGKTVTALSIMRLISAPTGRIVGGRIDFGGRNLLEITEREMRQVRGNEIAMVFQDPMTSLNPVLTIGRQLTEAMELHLGLGRKELRRRALELLTLVRIPDPEERLGQYPHQLSGGMRQRVMLAIALSCNPKLILADEPTTALDVTIQAQVLDVMKEVAGRLGVAMILITHDLGVIARYADRVSVMYAGKVVEHGSTAEIFRHPGHPYSEGLLASIPALNQAGRLHAIRGQPPDLLDLPEGCAYRPRCDYAVARCAVDVPPLMPVGGHVAACWVAAESGALPMRDVEA